MPGEEFCELLSVEGDSRLFSELLFPPLSFPLTSRWTSRLFSERSSENSSPRFPLTSRWTSRLFSERSSESGLPVPARILRVEPIPLRDRGGVSERSSENSSPRLGVRRGPAVYAGKSFNGGNLGEEFPGFLSENSSMGIAPETPYKIRFASFG